MSAPPAASARTDTVSITMPAVPSAGVSAPIADMIFPPAEEEESVSADDLIADILG